MCAADCRNGELWISPNNVALSSVASEIGEILMSLSCLILSPVHTRDKVEFNAVDFVEIALATYTQAMKSTVLATKSSCQILVADLLPKPATYRQQSTLLPI